jgi:hypothetical protein
MPTALCTALAVCVVGCALLLLEAKHRSKLPWDRLLDGYRRFGWPQSAGCVVTNAGLRLWARATGHVDRAVYDTDTQIAAIAPAAAHLRNRWRDVRREALRLLAIDCARAEHVHPSFALTGDLWELAVLKRHGRPFTPRARALMPATCALLARMDAEMALLSRLAPGTVIQTHCGPSYAFLRYHLCLVSDGRASITVGDVRYEWAEGHHVVFDETLPHSARNDSPDVHRLVLFVDLPRPLLGLPALLPVACRLTADMHRWTHTKKTVS